ncbi:MAG: class I SAM-dependent methyltransferase [Chloroflexota bacterium]|nr:class I SAM-dependent methyltransferase [Chloroflexota bacterium]
MSAASGGCTPGASDDLPSAPSGLETMTRELMHARNYHAWMYSQVEDFVGSNVLEVGAGSGNLTQFLVGRTEVTALDESRAALEVALRRVGNVGLKTFVADFADSAAVGDLAQRGFDTILSTNVLEHIEDDLVAITNMHEILKLTRGCALLIVPAHERLFGSLDRAAGHYRRYSRVELISLVQQAGFTIRRARYVNLLGAIAWYVNGSILRTKDLNAGSVNAQARLFDRIAVPVLRALESVASPPFGQSLVVVGQAVGCPKSSRRFVRMDDRD